MKNETGVTNKILPCVFCDGKGTDPFGIMSRLSNCPVCLGKGAVQVQLPYVTCAHCQGSGAIKRFSCTVCRGRGKISDTVGPTILCIDCKGTGNDASVSAMDCLTCRGRGRVSENNK